MKFASLTYRLLSLACLAAIGALVGTGSLVGTGALYGQVPTKPALLRAMPVTTGQPLIGRQVAQGPDAENKLSIEERAKREEAALAFAHQHHPALEKLLLQLRGMDQKEYDRAVRELYRVSERLGVLEERNPLIYEGQLELWKANSTATLLAARLQLNPGNEDLRQELRDALQHKLEAQKRLAQDELGRAQERVERVKQNLERLEREGPQMIERQMRQLAPKKPENPKRPEKK